MKNNLNKFRKEACLRADALADACGCSKQLIHNLEKQDDSSPKLSTAYLIARVLGKSIYDIWPDTTEVTEETIIRRRIISPTNKQE